MTLDAAVYCPFLVSALLGGVAPRLARRLPPATGTRLLVGSGVLAASSSGFALAVLAFTFLAQVPLVATAGHWSTAALASTTTVPRMVSVGAVVVGCVLALRGVHVAAERLQAVCAARELCARLGGQPGQLVVLDEECEPLAVPARGGRILASRAHLASLPADERRALLAHEGAHLAHRHYLYRLAADLAVAIDPLQHGLKAAVHYATERWADEAAAAAVGDRAAVARALARSALRMSASRPAPAWEPAVLHGASSCVVDRVRALLDPAPRQRPELVLTAVALVTFTLGMSAHTQEDNETYFESAISMAVVPATGAAVGSR